MTPPGHSRSIDRHALPIKLSRLACKKDYELQSHPQKRLECLAYPVYPPTIPLNCMTQHLARYAPTLPLNLMQSHPVSPPASPLNHTKSHTVHSPSNLACMKNQPILPEVTPQPHHLSTPSGHNPADCLRGMATFYLNLLSPWTCQQLQPLQPNVFCWSYMILSTCNSTGLA